MGCIVWFGDPLLHLDPAGATLGRADIDIGVAEPSQQATAGSERSPEVIVRQPKRTTHSRAAAVDELDVETHDFAHQLEPRPADVEGPKVARLMIDDAMRYSVREAEATDPRASSPIRY